VASVDLDSPRVGEAELDSFRARLDEIRPIFYSADQPEAIPMLSRLLDDLSGLQIVGPHSADPLRDLIAEALFLRAEAAKNLADEEAAGRDLRRLLTLVPDFEADATRTSPVLLEALEAARRRTVGRLRIEAIPADLRLEVDGRIANSGRELLLVEGHHRLAAQRSGYREEEFEVEITAGVEQILPLTLERISAVVWIFTLPAEVEVTLDGRIAGRTTVRPPAGDLASLRSEGMPPPGSELAELSVAGLQPGRHELELRKEGFRSRRLEVDVEEVIDYVLEPLILEPTEGTLEIRDLPPGASLKIDDRLVELTATETSARLALRAGEHRISVVLPRIGAFVRTVELADRETLEVAVEMRPIVSLVSVLGGHPNTSAQVGERLRAAFEGSGRWQSDLCDEAAAGVLERNRFDADPLRRLAEEGRSLSSLDSWEALRQDLDCLCEGSVHLLAVLSDEIYATWVDLWSWPADPPTASAERIRIELESPAGELAGLAELLSRPLQLEIPWLGAEFIDSAASPGIVVLDVSPGGPSAQAGLAAGDEILAVAGASVESRRQLRQIVSGMSAGAELDLEVRRGREPLQVTVRTGSSPRVLPAFDPSLFNAGVAAQLRLEATRSTPVVAEWVLELNRATALMRMGAWREAILTLQGIRIPADQAIDQ
jgi:hypothetical protein